MKKILIVDDEVGCSDILSEAIPQLLDEECQYMVAFDGKDGLEKYNTHQPFDLVISDNNMESMNGPQLFQRLPSGQKFILTSGAFTPERMVEYQNLGIQWMVPKPINMQDFQKILKLCLELPLD